MAKKNTPAFNYNLEVKKLRESGPDRLYLLFGEEDYLRERFIDEIKKICSADDSGFNCKRLDGPAINMNELSEAVDSVPRFIWFQYCTTIHVWLFGDCAGGFAVYFQ